MLDSYEGERYSRQQVRVQIAGRGGDAGTPWVWMLRKPWQDLVTTQPWDQGAFVREELEGYLTSYEGLQGHEPQ